MKSSPVKLTVKYLNLTNTFLSIVRINNPIHPSDVVLRILTSIVPNYIPTQLRHKSHRQTDKLASPLAFGNAEIRPSRIMRYL